MSILLAALAEATTMPAKIEAAIALIEFIGPRVIAAEQTIANIVAKIEALEALAQQAEIIINTKQGS